MNEDLTMRHLLEDLLPQAVHMLQKSEGEIHEPLERTLCGIVAYAHMYGRGENLETTDDSILDAYRQLRGEWLNYQLVVHAHS